MAIPGRSQIRRDLERFHKRGGGGYWDAANAQLTTLARLEIVRERVGSVHDTTALSAAIRAIISAALDHTEGNYAAASSALLGFTSETKALAKPTPREEAAAKALGFKHASAVRKPLKRLGIRGRPRSHMDVMLDGVAASIRASEGELHARRTGALGVAGSTAEPRRAAVMPDLDAKSPPDRLAAVWQSLPPLGLGELSAALSHRPLNEELRKVLAHLYLSFRHMHERQTFVSWSSALDLRMHDDENDWLYVLSRRDVTPGFRDQPGWIQYVNWLRRRTHVLGIPSILRGIECRGEPVGSDPEVGLNQIRVVIARDEDAAVDSVTDVLPLHRSGTVFYLHSDALGAYEYLRDLEYGLVISTARRYALISIPPLTKPHTSVTQSIPDFVQSCHPYDRTEGDMRAVFTAARDYVERLIQDFEAMLVSPDAVCLPSGSKFRESTTV